MPSASGKSNKPSRGTQRQRIEAREGAILAAAARVFTAEGVDGATMAGIARSADIAEGTLYLYYRNKQDLLRGVVADFWDHLTEGAQAAIDPRDAAFDQLERLAQYHLQAIVEQFGLIDMTFRARAGKGGEGLELGHIRKYVQVYDDIIRRGIDRGELRADINLWQSRDVFYGTLEFSARTLSQRGAGFDASVVAQLMALFQHYRCGDSESGSIPETAPQSSDEMLARLARIEARLDQLAK